MASNFSTTLDDLVCGICLERMRIPKKSGICNHTYCKDCLQHWISREGSDGTFSCPHCRARYEIPPGGADGLECNTLALELLGRLAEPRLRDVTRDKLCDLCQLYDQVTTASYYCPGCDGLYLCSACHDTHSDIAKTSGHKSVKLAGVCQLHSRMLKMYCIDCNQFACWLCVLELHKTEDHHGLVAYDKVLADAEAERKRSVEKAQMLLSDLEKNMEAVDRLAEITERKRGLWLQSMKKKRSDSLLEFDRMIEYLKKQRSLCEEQWYHDIRRLEECYQKVEDNKKAISKMEHDVTNILHTEGAKIDGPEAYFKLRDDFLTPVKNMIEEVGRAHYLTQCREIATQMQDTLAGSVRQDAELRIVSQDDALPALEKLIEIDRNLTDCLSRAISTETLRVTKKLLAGLVECQADELSAIDDVNQLWDFMRRRSLLARGEYDTLKVICRYVLEESELQLIAQAEADIEALTRSR